MISVRMSEFKREEIPDSDPDLSYLGEYSNHWREGAIETGRGGRECAYFIPAMSGAETGNPDSPRQDFERMEAYNRGEWGMIGVRACVQIPIPTAHNGNVYQFFHSPGIWGTESDSDESYLNELFREECAILRDMLESIGVRVIDETPKHNPSPDDERDQT